MIFEEYWRMESQNVKSSYFTSHMSSKEVSGHYAGPDSTRYVTYEYSVIVNKKNIVVCKKVICNIH